MPDHKTDQIELISAIIAHLGRQGIPDLVHREFNAIIKAATDIVDELAKPECKVVAGMGYDAWKASDHTGSSSLFMARVLMGYEPGPVAYPHDSGDFGRCVGLLVACPGLIGNIGMLAQHGPEWKAIAENWLELATLFHEEAPSGRCPRLSVRMQELGIQ